MQEVQGAAQGASLPLSVAAVLRALISQLRHRLNVSVVEGTAVNLSKPKDLHSALVKLTEAHGWTVQPTLALVLVALEVRSGHVKVPSTLDPSTAAGPVPRARPP